MKINRIRERIERVVTAPGEELGRWARFARFQIGLWRFCARRLHENNVVAMSAALSYRTIFALIPVLVLAFLVLKSVGALEDNKRSLRDFLEASGFGQLVSLHEDSATQPAETGATQPAQVINVAEEIESLVASVESKLTFQRLGPIGGALLIWTALTLLTTVERSLNRIFGAPRSRSLARRTLLYWSVLTLGPLALTAASYLGRDIVNTFHQTPGLSWLLVSIGWLGPIVVGILMLSALYTLLPNTRVDYRSALGGALVAVPLWLLAKWGISVYVQRLVVTGNLYGVLGALPLFLLWLNISWLIFLFGAELAHTAANLNKMQLAERAEHDVLGGSDMLATTLAIAQHFGDGRGPVPFEQVSARIGLPGDAIEWLLSRLSVAGLVCSAEHSGKTCYVLARPAERITVREVLEVADPHGVDPQLSFTDQGITSALGRIHASTHTALADLTLADLLTTKPTPASS
ncbi:MAG: YhjD/YihY/BrkB family envelope integrity protein [Planctomycetota bacterium]